MFVSFNPAIERTLQDQIFPDLEKGRKDFDLPHTKAVVYWTKELLQTIHSVELDPQVLITAAYAHDWGYIGLFDGLDSTDIDIIHKMKPLHMDRGAEKIEKLLTTTLSSFFSPSQIAQTHHLVLMHDRVEELQTESEILLMECDTLGMLDTTRVRPTFTKEDNDTFIQREVYGRRLKRFIHTEAKAQAENLALLRIAFYQ